MVSGEKRLDSLGCSWPDHWVSVLKHDKYMKHDKYWIYSLSPAHEIAAPTYMLLRSLLVWVCILYPSRGIFLNRGNNHRLSGLESWLGESMWEAQKWFQVTKERTTKKRKRENKFFFTKSRRTLKLTPAFLGKGKITLQNSDCW